MRLEDLNWMDVESYLKQDDRIILVTGACEQHGYLSLLTDIRIPWAIATAVGEREGVLVAPPLNFGCSASFAAYPGTISLSTETFNRVVVELVSDLYRQGFRRILILNGHGGNHGMRPALVELVNRHPDLRLAVHNWWDSPSVQAFCQEVGLPGAHANWLENFPFTRVAETPSEAKPLVTHSPFDPPERVRQALGDGSAGGPYQADDAIMDRLFNVAVEEALAILRAL